MHTRYHFVHRTDTLSFMIFAIHSCFKIERLFAWFKGNGKKIGFYMLSMDGSINFISGWK